MSDRKTSKHSKTPNYNFLISYDPSKLSVKGELNSINAEKYSKLSTSKKAAELAKADSDQYLRKDILKSIIIVSFILILEIVVYLARNKFGIK